LARSREAVYGRTTAAYAATLSGDPMTSFVPKDFDAPARVALDAGGRALRNEAVFRRRFDGGLRSHGVL
jgi:hypothetical protein